jgi:hypothetical protein
MIKRTDKINSFYANGGGRRFRLTTYINIIDAGTFDDPNSEVDGLKTLLTDEGYHCNHIDDETFDVLSPTGIIRVIKE